MLYIRFLDRVIENGKAAATESYKNDEAMLKGALEGFEACRGKNPDELRQLLADSARIAGDSYWKDHENLSEYWRKQTYHQEINWVCNVISVVLQHDTPIVTPTANGTLQAAKILTEAEGSLQAS